jgi:ketosteroid isomerase-like protein
MTTAQITRRDLLRQGLTGAAFGTVALAVPGFALAQGPGSGVTGAESHIGEIYQLQAAFHRAKTFADLDLMASLWADDATLVNQGDANSPYSGNAAIRAFFATSGSFTHRRLSLVPSFKTQINVGHEGDHAWLYFECHDVGDYDLDSRAIAADLFLAGIVRNDAGKWQFWQMTAGKSFPLSADHDYFP